MFPDLPEQSGSCVLDGVLGPVVGVIGSLQAQMVLSVIVGLQPSPLGRLVSVDGMVFGGFSFLGAPEPVEISIPFIDALDIGVKDIFIDVRQGDHEPVPDPRRVVLGCRSGLRAYHAAQKWRQAGQVLLAVVALGDIALGD